jgi:hypothetical protein
MSFEKPIIFRSLLSVALGSVALVLFVMNKPAAEKSQEQLRQEFASTLQQIDREIDSVLTRSGVQQKWIRKQAIPLANVFFPRIERRVAVPPEFLTLQLNAVLNSIAHRYNGRAVGTEDLKQHTVSIHIELQRVIVETIILKTNFDLKRKNI